MGHRAPSASGWVIVHSTHPSKGSAALPGEIAELLGVTREAIARGGKEARMIAFLARGPGTLRVVGGRKDARLVSEAQAEEKLVATASVSRTLVFNIPRDVYRHLGMRTRPLERPGPLGTDDQFAWAMPAEEYYAMRRDRPVPGPHVLLMNAALKGILPAPAELERQGHSLLPTEAR